MSDFSHIKLNYRFDKPDHRDYKLKLTPFQTNKVLPPSYDIRTVLPINTVFNQGELGSCTSMSSSLAYMFHIKKQNLPLFTPSRLFTYANSRILEGVTDLHDDSGATNRIAMQAIALKHVCNESEFPYVESNYYMKPPQHCYDEAKKDHPYVQYHRVARDLNAFKTCLVNNDAIIIGITVYESFMSQTVAENGIIPMPHKKTEKLMGGHSITIIGYSDEKKAFLLQNSWGENQGLNNQGWGLNGCCWIPFNYVMDRELAYDFWTFQ